MEYQVNGDCDKGKDALQVVQGVVQMLVPEPTVGNAGTHGDVPATLDYEVVPNIRSGHRDKGDTCDLVGPAVHVEEEGWVVVSRKGRCKKKRSKSEGPKVLRTRKGDLYVDGSIPSTIEGVQIVNGPNIGEEAQLQAPGAIPVPSLHIGKVTKVGNSMRAASKKSIPNRPNLPFNMMRKLPGNHHHKAKRKKNLKRMARGKLCLSEGDESDSIHNSDNSQPNQPTPSMVAVNQEGLNLEVVLSPCPAAETGICGAEGRQVSGAELISQHDGVEGFISREVVEATKLYELAEEMGLMFQGDADDDIARLVALEVRDAKEKEGWELRRGAEGFQ
ncbi:hypothetical protein P8452_55846 [Trifolium repens]|nr:hypothetical protein P8452_55846 [Trifolium repens]